MRALGARDGHHGDPATALGTQHGTGVAQPPPLLARLPVEARDPILPVVTTMTSSTTATARDAGVSHRTEPSRPSASTVRSDGPASEPLDQLATIVSPESLSAEGRTGRPTSRSRRHTTSPEAASSATTPPEPGPPLGPVGPWGDPGSTVPKTARSPKATGKPRPSAGWRHTSSPVAAASDTSAS